MWTPNAVVHFISYHKFEKTPSQLLFHVSSKQIAGLTAAASVVVTIGIRLSYKPIRDAILMNHLFRSGNIHLCSVFASHRFLYRLISNRLSSKNCLISNVAKGR